MRILICCNAYPPNFLGGAELVAHYQASALAEQGHQVRVFTGDRTQTGQRHSLSIEQYESLTVYRIALSPEDYRSEGVNFVHPLVEQHFQKAMAEFRPQIVHFHNLSGLSVAIVRLAKEFGAHTFLTLHDHWGFCLKNTLMKAEGAICVDYAACSECQPDVLDGAGRRIPIRLRQDYFSLAMQDVDVFISPSDYLVNAYIRAGFPQARMRVVWNGIDTARYGAVNRVPYPRTRFTFIGTFGRHKGVHILLGALSLLRNKNKAVVNLVGDGGQLQEFQKQLRRDGCEDWVRFLGKRDNKEIVKILGETDVFVLPSIWPENQPVSITEAMACGVAVIASNLGGIPELVEDDRTGYVFEAGNPKGLAEKMDALIEAPEKIESFGKAGRAKIQGNSFQAQVRRLVELYDELVGRTAAEGLRERRLIVCVGSGIAEVCAAGLELLPLYLHGEQPRVVMADWLTESQIESAALIWLAGATDQRAVLALAEKFGLPLLVPESCELLVAQCRARNCGLYYGDAHEAAAAIAYLLNHEHERQVLGSNARTGARPPAAYESTESATS